MALSKDAIGKGNCGSKPNERMGAKRQTGPMGKPKDMMKHSDKEMKMDREKRKDNKY